MSVRATVGSASTLGYESRRAAKDVPVVAAMRALSAEYPKFGYRRQANIETALIEPGKSWQNGLGESFTGKFRDECLSLEWFRNRTDAKIVIESWRRHYNEV